MTGRLIPTMTDPEIKITEPARPGRVAGIVLALVFLAWIVYQVCTNPGFQWDVVGKYMFHRDILAGVATTLGLTLLIMVLGTVIGIVLALMSLSGDRFAARCTRGYVWFFRGTPALVQLVFWYNLSALFPNIELGIPFDGPKFYAVSATVAISSFTAAVLGLGLNEGAYMGEIIRAGLLSVDAGQKEAAKALGYGPWQTFFVIVLPQAMKSIIPPTGNQIIGMLKYTSLASVVALPELMHSVELIYSRTFETIPLLIVASLWYLLMVSVLSIAQHWVEGHYAKGSSVDFSEAH